MDIFNSTYGVKGANRYLSSCEALPNDLSMWSKNEAYQFLKGLHARINEALPPPEQFKSEVEPIWKKPVKEHTEQIESRENIAFYKRAIPEIFEYGRECAKITSEEMRSALRCVYFKKYPDYSNANPFRKGGHPFSKEWGKQLLSQCDVSDLIENANVPLKPQADGTFKTKKSDIYDKIIARWRRPPTGTPANESWPEAGLVSPFPATILFEAKYFKDETAKKAEIELIKSTFETMYYRGLPPSGDWSYDYGCLVAFDVSKKAFLKETWQSVAAKNLFWESANIYVMVVRRPGF